MRAAASLVRMWGPTWFVHLASLPRSFGYAVARAQPPRRPFLCDAGDVLNLDITSAFVLGALVMLVVALFRLSRRRRDR